ncbi:hypothetical protein FKP32DRAFT_585174 [Trametes sanguinea]|nr:hypothetical protein FKP32DRAFT_585174 [Trametes sanguinea]
MGDFLRWDSDRTSWPSSRLLHVLRRLKSVMLWLVSLLQPGHTKIVLVALPPATSPQYALQMLCHDSALCRNSCSAIALFSLPLAAIQGYLAQPGVTRTHGARRRPTLAGVLVLLAQHVVDVSPGCPAAREAYRSTRLVPPPCTTRVLSGALDAGAMGQTICATAIAGMARESS